MQQHDPTMQSTSGSQQAHIFTTEDLDGHASLWQCDIYRRCSEERRTFRDMICAYTAAAMLRIVVMQSAAAVSPARHWT